MKRCPIACVVSALLVGPALAQPSFFDDFENPSCMGNWQVWPERAGPDPGWITVPLECDGAGHTISPSHSARAREHDPAGYCSYADFGATSGAIYAEVYVWDTVHDDGTNYDRPVSNMLALIAGNPVEPNGWNYTDYLQLGVVAWYDPDGLTETYSIRTKHRDDRASIGGHAYVDTGVPRKVGWTKLAIAVDAVADGGQVRFLIDDEVVCMSYRGGVDLPYVRLGLNFKSYDHFWYDDVVVTGTLPPDDFVRFDADGDGDVDQADFGEFQECYAGQDHPYDRFACWRMDADDDLDVDQNDLEAFEACASGPAISADPACDDTLPP